MYCFSQMAEAASPAHLLPPMDTPRACSTYKEVVFLIDYRSVLFWEVDRKWIQNQGEVKGLQMAAV